VHGTSIAVNVAAGMCLLAFWYGYALLLPFDKLPNGIWHLAVHRWWTPVNLLGVAGSLLAAIGLVVMSWDQNLGSAALVGVLLAIAGLHLLGGNLAWESLIWPVLATRQPGVLRYDGPLYTNRVLIGYFAVAGILFAAGYVTLAFTTAVSTPVWVSVGLGAGAPLFALGPMFGRFQVAMRSIGITALAIAQVGLSIQ
jgi:hypothetical protein